MGAGEEGVVRRICELYAAGDAEAMAALFAADGVYDNVPRRQPFEGSAAVLAYLRKVCERVTVEPTILHMASAGEWVLSERVDAHVLDGRRVELAVMNASHVVDGEVHLWRDYYDQQTVVDLGLV